MLRTATPAMVRNVGRDRWLRLLNSTSGAIASRRFRACAFCLAEKLRRSGSAISGREANRLDWFGSERRARAVQLVLTAAAAGGISAALQLARTTMRIRAGRSHVFAGRWCFATVMLRAV